MKLQVHKGKTSKRVFIFVQDSSKTDGSGLTGLTSGSGIVCSRAREDDGDADATILTLVAGTRGTYVDSGSPGTGGGFVEKDSVNQPGIYELSLDDAGLATGSDTVIYYLKGAINMAPVKLEIQLVDYDPQNSTNLGLSLMPAQLANGVAHGGATATFELGSSSATSAFYVHNSGGDAFKCQSTGGNGSGINTAGDGTGAGMLATGGNTGDGIKGIGGTMSGVGIRGGGKTSGILGAGLGLGADGIVGTGSGPNAGLHITGGSSGPGVLFQGGSISGDGIDVSATGGVAARFISTLGLKTATLTICEMSGGSGITVLDGTALNSGTGETAGFVIGSVTGSGSSGADFFGTDNAGGNNCEIIFGDGASGNGINVSAPSACVNLVNNADGDGIYVQSGSGGTAINVHSGGGNATGIYVESTGTGHVVQFNAQNTGDGLHVESVDGDAVSLKAVGGIGGPGSKVGLRCTGSSGTLNLPGCGATFTGGSNGNGTAAGVQVVANSGNGIDVKSNSVSSHDIALTGSGDISGDLNGNIIGKGSGQGPSAKRFGGVGVIVPQRQPVGP